MITKFLSLGVETRQANPVKPRRKRSSHARAGVRACALRPPGPSPHVPLVATQGVQ